MAFCSDDHPGAFLSALVFTGELFDEGLTKGDLEEAIARILEIPSENLVQGVGGWLYARGADAATGAMVFYYWLTGQCPLVRPIFKWRDGYYAQHPFVPLAEDLTVFGDKEAVIRVPVSHSGAPCRKRYSMAPNWCDELVDAAMNRRLSFGLNVMEGERVLLSSYNLEVHWSWREMFAGGCLMIEVVIDPVSLFLESDLSRAKGAIAAACTSEKQVTEAETPQGIIYSRHCFAAGAELRSMHFRGCGSRSERGTRKGAVYHDGRTLWDIVEMLEKAAGKKRSLCSEMERYFLWETCPRRFGTS